MLGRFQPWHEGHTALFKKALGETGQVVIMIRDVNGEVGKDMSGGRTKSQDDNPFSKDDVFNMICAKLSAECYNYGVQYTIIFVPNIVDISYGRDVGYTFTQHDLGEDIHNISATKIRKRMRDAGSLPSKSR